MATDHTCNGCAACIPELSADYWRERAHKAEHQHATAEELADAYHEQTRLLTVRIRELNQQIEQLQTQLARFWT
jgi:uncharacterized coiled-coil DUF342 family protein